MNDRERWIVYPLLFLALGASLRDKLLKQTMADRIYCGEMLCERIKVLDSVEMLDGQGRIVGRLRNDRLEIGGITAGTVDTMLLRQLARPIGNGRLAPPRPLANPEPSRAVSRDQGATQEVPRTSVSPTQAE